MNVFLGLNASAEELGVKRQNCWAFTTNNIDQDGLEYFNMDVDQVTILLQAKQAKFFFEGFPVKQKKLTEHLVFNWPSLQALDADVPLIFISFPSVKDPEWTNHPGEHLLSSSLANYTLAKVGKIRQHAPS